MTSEIRALLDRYHRAMITFDADAFADLYAADGVHEFPFRTPDGTQRLVGRDKIRSYYRRLWAEPPVRLDRIEDRASHQVSDTVIINEWHGTGRHRNTTEGFELNGVIVLSARNGELDLVRDYMDVYGLISQTPRPE
ncbi:nuclear transport factor 2 family protein [Microlunatus soli]|uniref:SnoaL-like domain-containing protein n=1 Tax=Microlunatus soli TaxID=630515 RepID=A0A1H2AKZ4_9ACTN|nr:nuclear transport factor 2 family protein [Microlunatus soli]SDT46524.1 SnoaL-like domain-containing protein [Microlunatus soli]